MTELNQQLTESEIWFAAANRLQDEAARLLRNEMISADLTAVYNHLANELGLSYSTVTTAIHLLQIDGMLPVQLLAYTPDNLRVLTSLLAYRHFGGAMPSHNIRMN